MGPEAILPFRVGYSECRFYVELASAAVIGRLPASSAWSFAIPPDTFLLGQLLCFQGAVEDPYGSVYGFVLGNALLVRLGW